MDAKKALIYQSILEELSEGVLLLSLDGKIESLNLAAKLIFGGAARGMIGKKIGSVFYEYSENDEFNQALLDVVYNPSAANYRLTSYFNGRETQNLYVTTSFLRIDGEPVGIIVVLLDVSELVDAELKRTRQITELLDSLVTALSIAIDGRSPYTANHTRNMVKLGEAFLDWLDETENPHRLDADRKHAFLMSVWLHDVGKLTVPLSIMDKATRLGNRLEDVEGRFKKISLLSRIEFLEGRISRDDYEARKARYEDWLEQIRRIDTAPFLKDEDMALVRGIGRAAFTDVDGSQRPVLTEKEIEDLTIRKGTLTDGERSIMQGHASATRRILSGVKFPEPFQMVPDWASEHHELLSGAGYPRRMQDSAIPWEVRLLTILDIFEALTAKDRPYKKPIPVDRSFEILRSMVREGNIDGEILDLFEQSQAWTMINNIQE